MMEHKESPKGGYDYEFVNPPPKSLECSICFLTLRDPHVISCCGYEFCQVCIERVQRDNKPCPLCNEQDFSTMLQKKIVREVNALVIRCPQKELGCEWEGELGQLQRHLNPGAGVSSTQGCEFLTVKCAYHCGAQLQRQLIQEHEMETCPKRPIEMQVASLMRKFEAVVIENQMLKQELDKIKNMHQKSLDEVKQELGDLKQENHQELRKAKEDLQRVCDVLKAGQKQIEANVDDMQKIKIASLEKKYTSLRTTTMPLPVPPFYIMVTNFNHCRVNNLVFKSDPFYSHADGYKLIVIIRPNGNGDRKGTHVSLYLRLLPGEFDDHLHWPFSGKITVQAYNRTKEQWSHQRVVTVMNERKCVNAPIGGGAGCNDFISLVSLDHYLKAAHSLRIRITGVEIL